MTRPRVVVAIPLLNLGGTEIQTLGLVEALVQDGYPVTVCCYHEHDPRMVERFQATGARIALLDRARSDGLWKLLLTLLRFFREHRPGIVHVQYIAPGLIPILAARLARVPVVLATVHIAGRVAYGMKAKVMLRVAARMCDAFICVSKGVERFWFGDALEWSEAAPSSRRHFTIYNAVDVTGIETAVAKADRAAVRRSLGVSTEPLIGFVGRIAGQKGLPTLLAAMRDVVVAVPSARLVVVGGGPDLEEMRRSTTELGLGHRVSFLGRREPEEIPPLLAAMDVLAVPSVYEGFGLVAAEAMAAGLPVVASDIEGLAEVVEDGVTGRLVPATNSEALASRLIEVLSSGDARRQAGQRGRARASRLFSRSRFGAQVAGFYRSIVCGVAEGSRT